MLDKIDYKILEMLQERGRRKRNELAEAVGLSIPSLSERLKKLEEREIIEGYHAKVNRKNLGYDLMAVVQVIADSSKKYDDLIAAAKQEPAVIECYSVLGEASHILKIVAKNSSELERLLAEIQSWPGVMRTITSLVLSTIKETTNLKLKYEE